MSPVLRYIKPRIKSPKFTVIGVGGAGNHCGGAGNAGCCCCCCCCCGAVIVGWFICVITWACVITGVAVVLSRHNEKRPGCSLI